MRRTVSEILEQVSKTEGEEAKVKILQENDNNILRMILKYNFDPSIKFLLPPGPVDFKKQRYVTGMTFYMEARKLQYLIAEHPTEKFHPVMSQADNPKAKEKRERMFLFSIENMDPGEADLFVKLKDKAIDEVSREIVDLAFPGLLPAEHANELEHLLFSDKKDKQTATKVVVKTDLAAANEDNKNVTPPAPVNNKKPAAGGASKPSKPKKKPKVKPSKVKTGGK